MKIIEEWMLIKDYPYYSISTHGRVKSKKNGGLIRKIWKGEYYSVSLFKDGERRTHMIHRLMAEAFIPNPENKMDVNHKDGNKYNNDLANLEWATRSENMKHAFENGFLNPSTGENNMHSKLNSFKVRVIRKATNFTHLELGKIFGVTSQAIGNIIRRKSWKHIKL